MNVYIWQIIKQLFRVHFLFEPSNAVVTCCKSIIKVSIPPFGDWVGHVLLHKKQRVTPVWCGCGSLHSDLIPQACFFITLIQYVTKYDPACAVCHSAYSAGEIFVVVCHTIARSLTSWTNTRLWSSINTNTSCLYLFFFSPCVQLQVVTVNL